MKPVRFFYDIACPYAYIASTQIEAICKAASAPLEWCPILLGGLYRSVGGTDHPATLRTVSHSIDTLLALGRPVEASALRSDWLHRVETVREGAGPRPEQALWLDRIEGE